MPRFERTTACKMRNYLGQELWQKSSNLMLMVNAKKKTDFFAGDVSMGCFISVYPEDMNWF